VGFTAGPFADLSDTEMEEVDPDRFVYSDLEMEAWLACVASLLGEAP
jgi:hypothetical protein